MSPDAGPPDATSHAVALPPPGPTEAGRAPSPASRSRASGPGSMLLVARLAVINQLRRVVATILLLLLPIGFYMSLRGQSSDAQATLGGLATASGWALAFTALFGFRANAGIDVRLTRLGLAARWIFAGRILAYAVIAFGLAVGLASFAALLDGRSVKVTMITVMLASVTAIPIGIVVGVLVPGEVEGALVVLALYGIPFALPVDSPALRFVPGYGSLKYAYSVGIDVSAGWFLHAFVVGMVATLIALALWGRSTSRGAGLD